MIHNKTQKHRVMLKEEPQDPQVTTGQSSQPQFASLDMAMDHHLFMYEKQSMPQPAGSMPMASSTVGTPTGTVVVPTPTIAERKKRRALSSVIFMEAEDPTAAPPPPDDAGGGLDLGLGGGDDDKKDNDDDKKPKTKTNLPQTPNIDINKFSGLVARLINNREALLDVQNTMLRRAFAFVQQNYNPQIAQEFAISLKTNYGLSVDTPSSTNTEFQPPPAAGAAADLLGG